MGVGGGSLSIPGRSQPNSLKMLLVLAVAAAVSAHSGQDYKMFMKWANGKAMESCWGEDNVKLWTVNMKKAVSKCMQEDAPELDLPPFRYMNRFTNSLVSMANSRSQDQDLYKMMKFMMMMKMMQQVGSNNQDHHSFRTASRDGYADETGKYRNNFDHQMMDRMDNGNMMENMMKMMSRMMNKEGQYERSEYDNMDMYDMFSKMYNSNKYDKYNRHDNHDSNSRSYDDMSPMMRRFMSKRQADDSLQLNDRLKEKLEHVMEEHVSEMSNMTCVLREMNVLNSRNNIDIAAMKADTENYNMPSQWFKQKYFSILDNCYEVAENQPAELDNMFNVNGNNELRNMGKIKSFLTCCKGAKMRLCMNNDTKKKIEANFGPVEELLQSFNNQINEEQLFFMVNEILQGSDEEYWW